MHDWVDYDDDDDDVDVSQYVYMFYIINTLVGLTTSASV